MTGIRRKARVLALQILYELDCTAHDPKGTLERSLEESGLPEEGTAFARELVEGVLGHRERLDRVIAEHAPAWPVGQLSAVDRNVLRIAIFEILVNNRTPPKAAINEAVELSKTFGSADTHKFINGVLGSVMGGASTEKSPTHGRT